MKLKLTGPQIKQLSDALMDAFPAEAALRRMIRFGLNENLAAIVGGGSLNDMVFDLITLWAEPQARTDELIVAARECNPSNTGLRAVAEQFKLAAESDLLEKIVRRRVEFADPEQWREKMCQREVTVCRVEIPTSFGTGFLLGPSVAMTNYHVVKDVIEDPSSRDKVVLRFDYKMTADGKTLREGQEYRLASNDDWLIDKSQSDELDYALMRLEGTPGKDSVGGQTGAPSRGWLNPSAHKFEVGDPLFVIQHPESKPLKFAPGSITGTSPAQNRVTYDTNTEYGSSGSPCFTSNWDLVALHHSRVPNANEGILFSAIMAQPKVKAALET
jgi:V8-like Glu-specific endopeptidase